VPRRDRHAETEFAAEGLLNGEAVLAKRGQGACCPRERADQHPRADLGETLGVAVESGEPDRGLVAEGDRQGLLKVGASCHRGVAVAARQVGEDRPQDVDVGGNEVQTRADLEQGRVAVSMMSWVVAPQWT
jgi:hypothetical protein